MSQSARLITPQGEAIDLPPEVYRQVLRLLAARSLGTRRRNRVRRYQYPNRVLALNHLQQLAGLVSLGGDALDDSESIYDGQ